MATEAELKINSQSVERTTAAVDALYESLVKLGNGAKDTETNNEKLSGSQTRRATALKNSNIASEKAVALLQLEQKNLDKTSQEYAELKGAILAKEVAAKKGIETSSKEYKVLKENITQKEKAVAATKKLSMSHKRLSVDTGKTNKTVSKFTDSLDNATAHVQLIDGPLGGVASRMSAFSRILKGNNILLAGLAISMSLVAKKLWDGVNVADRTEVAMAGINAQLIATNYASGQTAESLDHFARSLGFATLDNAEGVRNLVGIMNGFKKVSGDAFTRAIVLSQDLGLAMRQSPETAARTLGKVLENPIRNYKQLKRAGVELLPVEKERLKLAQQQGDIYAAQDVILKKLEGTFKGVAAAQADTLSGDRDTLGQNWEELWEFLGNKMIPTFRVVTQVANDAVVAARELFETEAETKYRQWAIGSNYVVESTENLGKMLQEMKEKLVTANVEAANSESIFSQLTKSVTGAAFFTKELTTAQEAEVVSTKRIIQTIEDLLVKRKEGEEARKQGTVSDEAKKALEDNERLLEQQTRLTNAFISTGDRRSEAYQKIKASIDAQNIAIKTNLGLESKEAKQLEANLFALSQLTEKRVVANTVLQKTKALQSKHRGLEKEIALFKLSKEGVAKNSEAYFQAEAAIDARNSAIQAGFEVGSKEHQLIEKQTQALAKLRSEAQSAKDLASAGFDVTDAGRVLISGSESALRAAESTLKGQLYRLLASGEIDKEQVTERIKEIEEVATERLKSNLIPLGFTVDEEGKTILLESVESVMAEKDALIRELETAHKEGLINDDMVYLERRNEIEREYDEKAIQAREDSHKRSAEHINAIRTKDTADSIASGLKNLSAVAGNNKKLAKMAKAASLFSASVSLVDGLSEANKLPYPANIPAYALALLQGTQLVTMASGLNEPSFAFGGVDISGKGTARSDSIKANIANGESVITATATQRHKETLKRMNSGLPIGGGGGGANITTSIVIQGDASEKTVDLIDERLRSFEDRVEQIANGAAVRTIQEEQEVGGLFNEI